MRSKIAVLAATICSMLAVPWAAASANNGSKGPDEFAVGSATNRFAEVGGPNDLSVAGYRSGSKVTGYARGSGDLAPGVPGGEFKVDGPITCLRVEPQPDGTGTRASIKYRYAHSSGSGAPPQGGGIEVFIEDNGTPKRGGPPVDGNGTGPPMTPEAFDASNPSVCDDPNVAGQPYNPVDSGDYVLRNAP